MKTILFFNVKNWNSITIKEYLKGLSDYKMRFGFSYILVIFNSLKEEFLKNSYEKILCVNYDKNTRRVSSRALVIKDGTRSYQEFDKILKEPNNVEWDLKTFGFIPERNKSILEIYDDIIRYPINDGNNDILSNFQCRDLIDNKNIDEEIKKHLLDIFALIVSGIQILISLQDRINYLKQYAGILANIFITRAKLEKIIFLIAKLDNDTIYYQKLLKGKKRGIRNSFLKLSRNSNFSLTIKLKHLAEYFEHFDNQFRTPEAHKKGRIFSLISDGHYGTLANEVLSFDNKLNQFFGEVLQYLRNNSKSA